jgi:hypothetical protein
MVMSRDGEIGRRSGFKIRRAERPMGVRFPLGTTAKTFRCSLYFLTVLRAAALSA